MKLKQRVIMMASLTGTMSILFIIGIQLSTPVPGPEGNSGGDHQVEEPRFDKPLNRLQDSNPLSWMDDKDKGRLVVVDGKKELHAPMALPGGVDLRNVPRRFHPRVAENPVVLPRHRGSVKRPVIDNDSDLGKRADPLHREAVPRSDPTIKSAAETESHQTNSPEPHNGEQRSPLDNAAVKLSRLNLKIPPDTARKDPWAIWQGWVKPDYLYPEGVFWSDEMNLILFSMATKPVTEFGVGHKGTQLKTSLLLGDEKQRTSFKPMR